MIKSSTAVFAVTDVVQSVAFYRDVLGFQERWLWENPPTFGCIGMGKAEVFLCRQPDHEGRVEGLMHFFEADDVEALHALHRSKGAPIISPLENKPWGIREYAVRDINGYHLRFSGPEKFERPTTATEALPSHIRIEPGLPTFEAYADLFTSVGWAIHRPSMEAALQHSLVGMLAIDTRDGQIAGMARATGDGRYFMIWDVIVRRSHQGQKIGSALIEGVLSALRGRADAGSFVGLFTGKPEFYERLGFTKGIGMHQAL
jgi:catechol 2,3-dioxygenase-like lactoylglutathione lyase family enzyme